MKINLQINKMMIKTNKQRYFDGSFRYSRASWGVLGCLGCPGVIRLLLLLLLLGYCAGLLSVTHRERV